MNKQTYLSLYLVLFFLTAGAGYVIGRFTTEPVIEILPNTSTAQSPKTVMITHPEFAKVQSEVEALRTENQHLRQQLEEVTQPNTEVESKTPTEESVQTNRRQSWHERMEALKERDPERYQHEIERRDQFVSAMRQMSEDRDIFLNSIDLTLLPPEAQSNHLRFINAMRRQTNLQEQMMALRESGEDISVELREEMGEVFREIHETRDTERTALLNAIAESMGLNGTDVDDFTTLVNEVFNATGMQMPRMGRPPRGNDAPQPPAP